MNWGRWQQREKEMMRKGKTDTGMSRVELLRADSSPAKRPRHQQTHRPSDTSLLILLILFFAICKQWLPLNFGLRLSISIQS